MDLQLQMIGKKYGKVSALKNVNLRFGAGIYGLVGPNGAGKSTLMRLLVGEEKITTGKIIWNDEDISVLKEKYKAHLGYLPQSFGFYSEFTGREMLLYIGLLKSTKRSDEIEREADELLRTFDLNSKANVKIRKYSGGMKQRLGIAQALMGKPEILILDEPTVGLDPMQRIRFKKVLNEYGRDRMVLISTHIMSDVQEIADYLIFLKDGNVVLNKSTEEAMKENKNLEGLYMDCFSEQVGMA